MLVRVRRSTKPFSALYSIPSFRACLVFKLTSCHHVPSGGIGLSLHSWASSVCTLVSYPTLCSGAKLEQLVAVDTRPTEVDISHEIVSS